MSSTTFSFLMIVGWPPSPLSLEHAPPERKCLNSCVYLYVYVCVAQVRVWRVVSVHNNMPNHLPTRFCLFY